MTPDSAARCPKGLLGTEGVRGLMRSGARLERSRLRAQLGVTCLCLGQGKVAVSSDKAEQRSAPIIEE